MQRTLQILNELEQSGAMSRYAIGGAMGATFYIEPLLTFDLDIFVLLPRTKAGLLTLAELYDALRAKGYVEEDECVIIEGVPAQFLPAYNDLLGAADGVLAPLRPRRAGVSNERLSEARLPKGRSEIPHFLEWGLGGAAASRSFTTAANRGCAARKHTGRRFPQQHGEPAPDRRGRSPLSLRQPRLSTLYSGLHHLLSRSNPMRRLGSSGGG